MSGDQTGNPAAPPKPLLEVRDLMVFFENALAVNGLSLEVQAGEIVGVIGSNSAGKTTLMNALSGLIIDMRTNRGGNIGVIQLLAERGAPLDVVNAKGWTPVIVADGVEYTPDVLKRYPEAAALLRKLLAERGLPVPPSAQER